MPCHIKSHSRAEFNGSFLIVFPLVGACCLRPPSAPKKSFRNIMSTSSGPIAPANSRSSHPAIFHPTAKWKVFRLDRLPQLSHYVLTPHHTKRQLSSWNQPSHLHKLHAVPRSSRIWLLQICSNHGIEMLKVIEVDRTGFTLGRIRRYNNGILCTECISVFLHKQ